MLYTYGYLFYLPITIICVIFFGVYAVLNKRPFVYYIMAIIAILYINMVIKLAFFPMLVKDLPEFSIYYNMCFKIQLKNAKHLLQNMILTMPIGVGIQYMFDLNFKGRMLVSLILAASIEIMQLIILVTVQPIDLFFDVNDLICNVCGAIIGILLSLLINKLIVWIPFEKKYDDLFTYMYKVGYNCNHKRSSLHNINKTISKFD